MDLVDKKKLINIEEFAIAIKNMYLKLAELEYNNQLNSQEYQMILELLQAAKRIEDNKFKSLYINADNVVAIKRYLERMGNYTDILTILDNQDYIEDLRLGNIMCIIIEENNGFLSREDLLDPIHGKELQDELADQQFLNTYNNVVAANTIFTNNLDGKSMPDDELRKYFIYLKYLNIYINPSYERSFIENPLIINCPIDINQMQYKVTDYTKEEFDCCVRNSLAEVITDDLTYLLSGDDKDFKKGENRLDLYRLLSLNKARLITLRDSSFITLMDKTINQIIEEDEEYQSPKKKGIRKMINDMFVESYKLLTSLEEKKKLELK